MIAYHIEKKVFNVKFGEVNYFHCLGSLLHHFGRGGWVLLLPLLWWCLVAMRVESRNRRGWGLLLKHKTYKSIRNENNLNKPRNHAVKMCFSLEKDNLPALEAFYSGLPVSFDPYICSLNLC